ncbi:hypothetical protein C2857_006829 [Epichloe festucae Fl1]|uniref:Uncharacterized protein n=1 Tax=Epichloe festucae (strain Fl1) TaxID=877507 RepID=A0A7S9PW22_EPIFF|nr:hypothetical protein C2857_006829 [Epichloe festucae Fl1]
MEPKNTLVARKLRPSKANSTVASQVNVGPKVATSRPEEKAVHVVVQELVEMDRNLRLSTKMQQEAIRASVLVFNAEEDGIFQLGAGPNAEQGSLLANFELGAVA